MRGSGSEVKIISRLCQNKVFSMIHMPQLLPFYASAFYFAETPNHYIFHAVWKKFLSRSNFWFLQARNFSDLTFLILSFFGERQGRRHMIFKSTAYVL